MAKSTVVKAEAATWGEGCHSHSSCLQNDNFYKVLPDKKKPHVL